ncbi:uncharacterized protein TNCT_698441 [Trichonephila clavata]|uniref:Uncharacterized protein n=1 Tax=Trichonephila clavata TaxID=2740835 RepID=A0A8X6H1G0_TRICU|nr:uncharacterized protein TNCT_698441 [Trichonephila clavata]
MKIEVIILLIASTVIEASLLNTGFYPKSLYGGFSYTSPYEAIRNYHRARYNAKKAFDIARLRAGIYGLGNGFYGYGYGNLLFPRFIKPVFPGYIAPITPPIGLGYNKPYIPAVNPPPSVFPVSTGYVPKTGYGGSYSQNFAYGKGYSYSKNIFDAGPNYQFPRVILPAPNFVAPSVPISKVTPIILGSGFKTYSPGYQYSYFVKGPPVPKGIPQGNFIGYNSIYGTRYNKFPPPLPVTGIKGAPGWKGIPIGSVPIVKDPFRYDPNFNVMFDDYQARQLIGSNKETPWENFPSDPVLGNTGYSLLPPVGQDFGAIPPPFGSFSDPYKGYAARSDTDAFKSNESLKSSSDAPDSMVQGPEKSSSREIDSESKSFLMKQEKPI